MGGDSQTTTQSNTIDPKLMSMYQQNFADATKVGNTPFTPYTAERVASFSPTQVQGQGLLTDISKNNVGAGTLNQAKAGTSGVLGFTPQTVTAGQLSNTDLSPYMNPYTNDVINASLADLQRARAQQQIADNQSATAAGAFGGTRQSVRDSLTTDDYLRNVGSLTASLRNTGYQNAQNAALSDISNRLAASTTNASNDLSGAGLRLSAAQQLSGMSDTELQQALQRAGVVQAVGEQQTDLQQQRDNAAYEEFLRKIGYPQQQQDIKNKALGIIPVQQTTTSRTDTSKDQTGNIMQGIGTAASIAAMFM